jgi:p-aminobenzoyl-glutamate transporter AbgT
LNVDVNAEVLKSIEFIAMNIERQSIARQKQNQKSTTKIPLQKIIFIIIFLFVVATSFALGYLVGNKEFINL